MDVQLTQLLVGCTDPTTCQAAEAALRQAEENNLADYLRLLARELRDESKPQHVRQLAGLMLKNATSGKDKKIDSDRAEKWLSLPPEVSDVIKQEALETLKDSSPHVQGAAAQVISKLGRIELPQNRWPQIFPQLLELASSDNALFKKSAQTAIGYLCEDLADALEEEEPLNEEQCNNVLTTTVKGMSDTNPAVKLAATKAFYHAVLFARENFKKLVERNVILEVVCTNCKEENPEVQSAAFECIVQIATEYYEYLVQYMNVIGPMTWGAIQNGSDNVAIPALEFWNTICDEEIEIGANPNSQRQSQDFVKSAMPYLLPILLEALKKQGDEEDDTDTWTLSMAGGTCLSLCSQVVRNDILDPVLAFVNQNFGAADWKRREAAVMAYGSIMEGPDSDKLKPLVQQSFQALCGVLDDQSVSVRDTAAWAIGRIAAFHTSIIIPLLGEAVDPANATGHTSTGLMSLLLAKLTDRPRVAANICWVISELAEHISSNVGPEGRDEQGEPLQTALDSWFIILCQALIAVAQRPDADEKQLREAACNALSSVIQSVGTPCTGGMEELMSHFLQQLEHTLAVGTVTEESLVLQNSYCICLQSLFRRLDQRTVPYASKIWPMLSKILLDAPAGALSEEALLAVACLARAIKGQIEPYMDDLNQILLIGLANSDDIAVYKLCAELVGDVSRIMRGSFARYSERLLLLLYDTLKNAAADRHLKPQIMIAVGDVAMSLAGEWEKFLGPFMDLLSQAASTKLEDLPDESEDWIIYLAELRDGVLQAYIGIVYGIKEGGKLELLKIHVNRMLELVQLVAETDQRFLGENNLNHAIALTGDLVNAYGAELMQHLKELPFLQRMLQRAEEVSSIDNTTVQETRENAKWLNIAIQKSQSQPGDVAAQ